MSLSPRRPGESVVETAHLVLPPDTNHHGTAFGGIIMQWMDIAGGIAAGRHCRGPTVTVAVDELVFARPIRTGDVVLIRAEVTYAGKTSMEVCVNVEREDGQSRDREHCLTGYFTFVAIDKHGRPQSSVPPLLIENDAERALFEAAKIRRQARLAKRQIP